MRTLTSVFLALVANSAASAQQAGAPSRVRVIGVLRDTAGAPVRGAVVIAHYASRRQITFSRADGRFELPGLVPDTARLEVLHLAYWVDQLRVSALPRVPQDSKTAVANVVLRSQLIDTTPVASSPPFHITAPSMPDAELELITRAARLRPLREVKRSQRDPEIRVWIHGGAGTPDRAAILRQRSGRTLGEVWLWWILSPSSGLNDVPNWRLRAGAFGCSDTPWQWGTVLEDSLPNWRAVLVCRATLPVTPHWQGMWRRLDSLDVWRLSNVALRRHRPLFVTDGAMVTVERFDGRQYRLSRHGHPDSIATPEAQRAAAIAKALDEAFLAVRYNPEQWILHR